MPLDWRPRCPSNQTISPEVSAPSSEKLPKLTGHHLHDVGFDGLEKIRDFVACRGRDAYLLNRYLNGLLNIKVRLRLGFSKFNSAEFEAISCPPEVASVTLDDVGEGSREIVALDKGAKNVQATMLVDVFESFQQPEQIFGRLLCPIGLHIYYSLKGLRRYAFQVPPLVVKPLFSVSDYKSRGSLNLWREGVLNTKGKVINKMVESGSEVVEAIPYQQAPMLRDLPHLIDPGYLLKSFRLNVCNNSIRILWEPNDLPLKGYQMGFGPVQFRTATTQRGIHGR